MKTPLLLFSLLFFTFYLFPQTAERIESLLEQDFVSYEQAALFVIEAAELVEPDRMSQGAKREPTGRFFQGFRYPLTPFSEYSDNLI